MSKDGNSAPCILLVESDPISREIGQAMLENCRCRVHVVGSAHEAVEAFSLHSFDMIFMECRNPETDVFKATGMIRSMESGNIAAGTIRHTPIVALSASATEGSWEKYLQAGMDDFLAKPYRIADLQQMLDRWISVRRKNGDSPQIADQDSPAVNRETLDEIASLQPKDSKTILTKLISLYFDSSSKHIQNILDAVKNNDVATLQTAAHTLKSSSASLGAMNLSEKCKELEMMARSGDITGAADKFPLLEREYGRVLESLNLFLASLEK
ncbi:MAG: Signal transduction histidine-protein kinase BarA [Syntrophus sp. PtaB.Bin001]|nr:MAG: Signal transduction histidine-protein kinase BarA [Syntrophus sp. PtaB.Bin001]